MFRTMENSLTEFSIESPTCTNTTEFEQSVEVRTEAKSESGIVEGFPSKNISSGRDPYAVFTSVTFSLGYSFNQERMFSLAFNQILLYNKIR